jgi:hypothetical protein
MEPRVKMIMEQMELETQTVFKNLLERCEQTTDLQKEKNHFLILLVTI